ncbi:MAG: hypothetical protein M1818_004717 [Claussenomyces sp. TS43310]|nr:MAG: hypothetical protein M1818_004717 [Claussenomyces sp. TS43310]
MTDIVTTKSITRRADMDPNHEGTNDRRDDDMSEAIRSMSHIGTDMDSMELPSDPDAQATVTDFLDYTEYLPSDMTRSLTLIGKLDQTYIEASINVHEATKTYGLLPVRLGDERIHPIRLRADISQSLNETVNARTLSYAEACRMADNVERHYNRAKNIFAKLQAMAEAYPVTRETSVQPATSPEAARPPKITLRFDGARSATNHASFRLPKQRTPRITVPGEVLAPYELDYESYDSDSEKWDSADDELLSPVQTTGRAITTSGNKIKVIKLPKLPKVKAPKPPRGPRPPGVMGTNVHSAVAGISTSNALAKLDPPPENAVLGSADAPWLQLTAWELAKLRKRMKKNAVWSPSDTMVLRELKSLGRGPAAKKAAKAHAEAEGRSFVDSAPAAVDEITGKAVIAEGAISADAVDSPDVQLSNRGMKLNEAKKLKRELQAKEAKEASRQAAQEMEEVTRKMPGKLTGLISGLFAKPANKDSPTRTIGGRNLAKKRKRESSTDTDVVKLNQDAADLAARPQPLKKTKTETPVPVPASSALNATSTKSAPDMVQATDPASLTSVTITTKIPLRSCSPKKSVTPILPPTRASKRDMRKDIEESSMSVTTVTSNRQISQMPTPTPPPPLQIQDLPSRRPNSRGKAASLEPIPSVGKDRPRRASTVHNTPAPEIPPPRPASRRGKRPAPGPLTTGAGGSAAISVGKRSAPPRKKAGPKKQHKDGGKDVPEIWDEIDDEGNIIDPNEPRYCVCNRVSFGVMICCEKSDVSWKAEKQPGNPLT